MMELFAEASHENVQVGLKCAQVLERVHVDLFQQILVDVVRIHVFRTNRENSIGYWDVDVRGVLDETTN